MRERLEDWKTMVLNNNNHFTKNDIDINAQKSVKFLENTTLLNTLVNDYNIFYMQNVKD